MKIDFRWAGIVLALSLTAFLASDARFSLLEDETSIVEAARAPLHSTLALFWFQSGQHEHPPLSDLLLHLWLPLGGSAQWSLRLPSMLFFLAGLVVLGLAARKISGDSAFRRVIAIGVLSPFAFHFARLVGWYSFTFFLVCAATLAHLDFLAKPDRRRLAAIVVLDALLIYSNYYCLAIVACLAFEVCLAQGRRAAKRFLPVVFGALLVVYLPLWRNVAERGSAALAAHGAHHMTRTLLNALYSFYSLFVSESVAPWFPGLSLPAALAITVALAAAWSLLSPRGKRFLLYFAVLFCGMAALGLLTTKRLLFISPWLLLAFASALAAGGRAMPRRILASALALIAVVGWIGIVSRKYYAAPHFIEPWAELARDASQAVKRGDTVIANSPSFLFYCNWRLPENSVLTTDRWNPPQNGRVILVTGVNIDLEEETSRAKTWLGSHCRAISLRQLAPDSGYALKARFFPGAGQQPYGALWQEFDCAAQ